MDLGLAGMHVVVTGASSGLGLATAQVLCDEGARVTIVARDRGKTYSAAAILDDRAHPVVVDLTDRDAPAQIISQATAEHGKIDALFVSHGGPAPTSASSLEDHLLDNALDVALRAPLRLVREMARAMSSGGSIVVLTSTSSVQPIEGLASSNVTRTAMWGYVKSLSDELGPSGIRVNALLAGRYETARLRELEDVISMQSGAARAQVRADAARKIPLRRLGMPDELGRVAAFLLSPAASYVTGAAWTVDGGSVRGL
ncbi:MAG: 3-oxoacyl-[acyl-carrier protein] reductase [Myxococcota bacterium]|jgi:3-oxoacyl-[acyl-carrier protein] reductase